MFVNYGKVFALTEEKPAENHDDRHPQEMVPPAMRRRQTMPVLEPYYSYDEESFEEEFSFDEGFVWTG